MSTNLIHLENKLVQQADQKVFYAQIMLDSLLKETKGITSNADLNDTFMAALPIGRCMMICILACREIDVSLGVALEAAMRELNLKT